MANKVRLVLNSYNKNLNKVTSRINTIDVAKKVYRGTGGMILTRTSLDYKSPRQTVPTGDEIVNTDDDIDFGADSDGEEEEKGDGPKGDGESGNEEEEETGEEESGVEEGDGTGDEEGDEPGEEEGDKSKGDQRK